MPFMGLSNLFLFIFFTMPARNAGAFPAQGIEAEIPQARRSGLRN
jgi:hypothetical protein